ELPSLHVLPPEPRTTPHPIQNCVSRSGGSVPYFVENRETHGTSLLAPNRPAAMSGVQPVLGVSGHIADMLRPPPLTPCGHAAIRLFDHLVGSSQQCRRNFETEHLGGLEVNDQLEFGQL